MNENGKQKDALKSMLRLFTSMQFNFIALKDEYFNK